MDDKRLRDIPLFAGLSKRELKRIAQLADEVDVAEGKELIHEGRYAYEFFVIEEGHAEVVRDGAHIADLREGDFFGEMGADAGTRNATVVARSPLTAVVMGTQDFRRIRQEMPSVAGRIRKAVEARTAAAG